MKKILIIDDHELMCYSIKHVLDSTNKYSVHICNESTKALDMINDMEYDLLMIDIEMPGINGIQLAKKILKKIHGQKILFITGLDYTNHLDDIISLETNGFILKSIESNDLIHAVDSVIKGSYYYGSEIVKEFLVKLKRGKSVTLPVTNNEEIGKRLSYREFQIVKYICEGLTSGAIAEKMFLSKRTVDAHRYNILKKLNLKNTTELIAVFAGTYKKQN